MRRLILILSLLLVLVPAAAPAFAQESGTQVAQPNTDRTVRLRNPLDQCPTDAGPDDPCRTTVPELVGNIIKALVGVVGAFALLIFVYGGFLWLTSGGEAGKVQQGKDAMKWAIVGLFVVFSSYALVSFVLSALTG